MRLSKLNKTKEVILTDILNKLIRKDYTVIIRERIRLNFQLNKPETIETLYKVNLVNHKELIAKVILIVKRHKHHLKHFSIKTHMGETISKNCKRKLSKISKHFKKSTTNIKISKYQERNKLTLLNFQD